MTIRSLRARVRLRSRGGTRERQTVNGTSIAVALAAVNLLVACQSGRDVAPSLIVPGSGEGTAVSLSSVPGLNHVVGSLPLCLTGDVDQPATVTAVRPLQADSQLTVEDFAVRRLPAGSGQNFLQTQPGVLPKSWVGQAQVSTRCAGDPPTFVDGSPHIDELVIQVAGVASATAVSDGFVVEYEFAGRAQTLSIDFPVTVCPGQTEAGRCL